MSTAEGNCQKACPRGGGESVQQGRSSFDARSVHVVREHGKRARTPLAAFFNIPKRENPTRILFVALDAIFRYRHR